MTYLYSLYNFSVINIFYRNITYVPNFKLKIIHLIKNCQIKFLKFFLFSSFLLTKFNETSTIQLEKHKTTSEDIMKTKQ